MFNGIYGVQAQFQPTLPLRGATPMRAVLVIDGTMFQPTLPLRGATRAAPSPEEEIMVSTHAPLAGSDPPPTSRS